MKKFGKILAMVMVALMMMSVVAMAEEAEKPAMGDPAINEKVVTVSLSGLAANEEATILVVNDIRIVETDETDDNGEKVKIEEAVELASLKNTDIVYIDQLTADDNGTVTFTLDASNAVANSTGNQLVNIYCGYTNMNVAEGPLMCEDLLINPVDAPEFVYGDVDGNGTINATDASLILSKFANSATVFPCGNDNAGDVDGNGTINATDASLVLSRFANSSTIFPAEQK